MPDYVVIGWACFGLGRAGFWSGYQVRSGCRWRDGGLVYQFSCHEFWWSGMGFISVRFTWADSARHETTGNQLAKCLRPEFRACPPWVLINAWLQSVKETIDIVISVPYHYVLHALLDFDVREYISSVFAACTCCTIRGTSLSNKSALL